jgi:hypothetical protein
MSPARLGLAMQVVEFNNDFSRTPIGLRSPLDASRIQFERGHIFQAAETAPSLSANDARWADQAPSSMRPCDRSALSCGHVAAARRHRRMAFKHDMRKPPSESLSDVVTGKFKERWAASR